MSRLRDIHTHTLFAIFNLLSKKPYSLLGSVIDEIYSAQTASILV